MSKMFFLIFIGLIFKFFNINIGIIPLLPNFIGDILILAAASGLYKNYRNKQVKSLKTVACISLGVNIFYEIIINFLFDYFKSIFIVFPLNMIPMIINLILCLYIYNVQYSISKQAIVRTHTGIFAVIAISNIVIDILTYVIALASVIFIIVHILLILFVLGTVLSYALKNRKNAMQSDKNDMENIPDTSSDSSYYINNNR